MPVQHLMLTNHNPGNILYSYYFQSKEENFPKQLIYEQILQQAVYRTAAVKPTRSTITLLEDKYVVFQRVGEVIIYLTGVNEADELILSEVLDTLIKLLQAIIGSSSITESSFLNSENYGKFVIAIDEMLPEGFYETNDVESLLKASKLKNH